MSGRSNDAEIIVVGAGPAGASCAALLAEQGHDVLMIDQASFPRDKPCGDGLTRSAVSFLDRLGLGELIATSQPIEGLRMVIDNRSVEYRAYRPTPRTPHRARCIPRGVLDHALFNAAPQRGARFLRARVTDRFEAQNALGVRALIDGEERALRARFVVAADGATSRLRRTCGYGRRDDALMAYAVRAYFRCERPAEPVFDTYMPLELGPMRIAGYGWAFPIDAYTLNIGVGYWRGEGISSPTKIREVLHTFVGQLRVRARSRFGDLEQTSKVCGSPLGVHFHRDRCELDGIVFVGDAARTTDRWSGEGIAYALHGAQEIAELIHTRARLRSASTHAGAALGRRFGRLGQDPSLPLRLAERRLNHSKHIIEGTARHPFLRTVQHVIAAPEEEPSLLDTPVGRMLETHPGASARLLRVNETLLDELETSFPFAAELLHCKVRDGLGPVAAGLTFLCAGQASDDGRLIAAASALELIRASAAPIRETIDRPTSGGARLNNALCVLITDFALSRGARQAVRAGAWMTRELSLMMKDIYRAQFLESQRLFDIDSSAHHYIDLASARTSAPLALAARFAGSEAGRTQPVVDLYDAFGRALGLAVHICEDLQNLLGLDDPLGRAPGSDLRLGAYPLPLLQAAQEDRSIRELLRARSDDEQVPAIVDRVVQTKAMVRALDLVRASVDESRAIAARFDGDDGTLLDELAMLVLERTQMLAEGPRLDESLLEAAHHSRSAPNRSDG